MQCEKCKYVLKPFDDVCPRCGADTSKQIADALTYGDDVAIHPFPTGGRATVAQDGVRYGPYTLSEINSLIKSSNLAEDDELKADTGQWVPLKKVQGVIAPPKPAPLKYPTPTTYEGNIPYNDILSGNTEKIRIKSANIGVIALSILAFLLPILGFLIWLVLRNKESPMTEKIGTWTYYGLIFNLTFFGFMKIF